MTAALEAVLKVGPQSVVRSQQSVVSSIRPMIDLTAGAEWTIDELTAET